MSTDMETSAATTATTTINDSNFPGILAAANRAAWAAVVQDPVLNASLSAASAQVTSVAGTVLPSCDALCSCPNILGYFSVMLVARV